MSKLVRSVLVYLVVLQLIIPYSTFAAAVGEFTAVTGEVLQTRATEAIKPAVKSPIELKDLIATAQSSSAALAFLDETAVTLSENTKLEVNEFTFKDQKRRGIFTLPFGKLKATVKKYIGDDNVFEIRSQTVGVGVRGTEFEFVEATKDGTSSPSAENPRMATVSCTDGSLNLSAFSDTGAVVSTSVLEAGQVAVIVGGVITISAIVAATAAGGASTAASGGASGAAAAGGAAATTGLSTAAIAGIAIGGAAVVGGAAAAAGGGGGGGSSAPVSPVITEQTLAATWGITGSANWGATTSGTIQLNSGGTYTYTLTDIQPSQSPSTVSGTGTWSLSGTSLTLRFDRGAVYNGTAQGSSTSFSMVCSNGWTLNFARK